jgi:hypothetical protein
VPLFELVPSVFSIRNGHSSFDFGQASPMQALKAQSRLVEADEVRAVFHLQALQQLFVVAESETISDTVSPPNSAESMGKVAQCERATCDCSPTPGTVLPGTVVRCVAPYGVAIRAGPDFKEKTKGFVRSGDTVCIAERYGSTNWIREMDGWIPLTDPRGKILFEIEEYSS